MLGDPRRIDNAEEASQEEQTSRFKFVKLEERIAPRHSKYHGGGPNCHYNPNAGKYVGCGKPN